MKYRRILPLLALALCLAACRTEKSPMQYFMDIDEITTPMVIQKNPIKIEPGDELFINISSAQPEATVQYNLPANSTGTKGDLNATANARYMTYIVDPEGYIMVPSIGKIKVEGMTVEQLRDYILEKVSNEVEDPTVVVYINNFKVNIGGEVLRPGPIRVTSPRFSILDAIASAGDLNQYGERNKVLLIREENGELKHIRLDLNSADVLTSPYFYLKQNDYIYVEPNKIRKDNSEYNQYDAYKLSVVTTVVSGAASVISLIIALSR